jgi:hypothetical protein
MAEETKLLLWASEQREICRQIRSSQSHVKIILKTKNEAHLLQRWIDHHVQIAGKKNVIIMDNCSVDSVVLDIYQRNSDQILIFAYGGHHNSIHRISDFPELYDALRESCKFYIFIDTDEFLFWGDQDRLVAEQILVGRLDVADSCDVFPGVWLHNYPGCDDIFFVSDYSDRIIEGVTWGKPLVSSRVNVQGFINHNCQLKGSVKDLSAGYGLFVAHFNRLIPQQRITQNIQKLLSRKVIKNIDEIHELLRSDAPCSSDGNVELYVREIRSLEAVKEVGWPKLINPPSGTFKLAADGTLFFGDDVAKRAFANVRTEFQESWHKVPVASL